MAKAPYDPRDKVEITKVDKRGEHYTVEGIAEGKRTSFSVAAPDLDKMKKRIDIDAFMRRSLLGVAQSERER